MTSVDLGPIVEGDATLRMLGDADLPLTLAWRNHPESRAWFHSTAVIAAEDHRAWFARYLSRDDDAVFILELAGRPVAQAALSDIAEGSAEFGRLLVDPEARGRGVSHRVIALVLRLAEERLGLREVHLEVKADNLRAIRAYEAAGFVADPETAGAHGAAVFRRTIR